MASSDAIVNIPMSPMKVTFEEKQKQGVTVTTAEVRRSPEPMQRPSLGRRRTTDGPAMPNTDDELTKLGQIYDKVINSSPIVRWSIYILPMAAILAIPLVLCDTVYYHANVGGIRLLGLFIWIEVAWVSLWVAKLIAILMPMLFQSVCGLISSGIRKYSLLLRALEVPVSLFIWAILCFSTNRLVYVFNRDMTQKQLQHPHYWFHIFTKVLRANIATTAIFLFQKTLIQLIGVNYNRTILYNKIKENKHIGHVLDMMYEASALKYPAYTQASLMELDINIHENTDIEGPLSRKFMSKMTRLGDGLAEAFGNMASEITGKQVFKPTATHHIINSALERKIGAESLGERIWRTFIIDPEATSLTFQDLIEELGEHRADDAHFIFDALDRDGNGDVSLDEIKLFTVQVYQHRRDMYKGYQDVKEALKVLDSVLLVIVLIIIALIYAAFFSNYLASNWTKLWGIFTGASFMLGATAAELFGACILVFIKHPYDIGDRVQINKDDLVVDKISLLYTIFRRVGTNGSVQIPNSLNNANWIDNYSRSRSMKEQLTFSVSAGTSFADIEALRAEVQSWLELPENRRDYHPDVEIELMSAGDLSKMDLKVEVHHKSNWSNESLRAYRRSKFNCALLSAMRRVPIDGTGGSGPSAGSKEKPAYSVAITDEAAKAAKAKFEQEKEVKRLYPTAPAGGASSALELLPSIVSRRENAQGQGEVGVGR